jgi:hypothetical protein
MWKLLSEWYRRHRQRHEHYVHLLHRFEADHVTEREREHPTPYFWYDSPFAANGDAEFGEAEG